MSRIPDGDGGEEADSDEEADSLLVEAARHLEPVTPAQMPASAAASRPFGGRAATLTAGTLVAGRYRLDVLLGEGGMGEVWSATHTITRRRVAMKFLKASAPMRRETRQRFLREARAASLVHHPSVVEVLDAFELEDGVPVMVLDLLTGETLRTRLTRDKVLGVGEVAALLLPAVEAVEAAHAIGIVHRDLKPENLFLCAADGGPVTVKVLDFGIAKLTATEGDAAETGALTGSGAIVGTPWYMAPEQCCGEKDIDARADVWALGVIMYECLCGERPLAGANVGQLVKAMLNQRIVPIAQRAPDLPPELSRLIGRMLSPDRGDRPRSLEPVRAVLSALVGGPDLPRRRPRRLHRLAGIVAVAGVGVVAWGVAQLASNRSAVFRRAGGATVARRRRVRARTVAVHGARACPRGSRHRPAGQRQLRAPPEVRPRWSHATRPHDPR